jgi:4-coumarate--CoA ligase
VSVGTNPSYTRHELSHAVKIAKIRFVIAEPEILPNMVTALQENDLDVGQRLFILDTQPSQQIPSGLKSWRALLDYGLEDWIRFEDRTESKEMAQLYFTSGTSGLPKCAATSHLNLVSEHQLFFEQYPRKYPYRIVLCMPFFHVGILPQVLVSAIREGREAYVMRRFELEPYLKYHAQYKITETFMVPPMVISIVMSGFADPKSKNYRPDCSLKSVRNGTVGAAPCSGDMQRRFHALLGNGATFGQVWGMTETTSMAAIVPWDVAHKTAAGEINSRGTVGRPLPEVQMKLVDEQGEDVTDKGGGELCVKGPTVVQKYFENEKATKESWDADGYFKTGDVIQIDPQTWLMYVVERVKELTKVRGFQVAPAELEGVLTAHPDIVDAAVIGIPVSEEVELPRAYIVRREGTTLEAEQVQAHMRERLARYKQLEGGVYFLKQIPKLPSGKILKRVLREMAKKDDGVRMGPKL